MIRRTHLLAGRCMRLVSLGKQRAHGGLPARLVSLVLLALSALVAGAPAAATQSPQVASGFMHNLLLRDDGTLWAWGYNGAGQLGDGTTISRSTPVQVMAGVAAVSAGFNHTLAIRTDGTLWAWGANAYGQLGDGTNAHRLLPVQIMTGVQSVAAGGGHTLAVKADGSLWAWGENASGQLGDGSLENRLLPVLVMTGVKSAAVSLPANQQSGDDSGGGGDNNGGGPGIPRRETGGKMRVAGGASGSPDVYIRFAHSLAVKSDGTLWSWGYNGAGQLGMSFESYRSTPGLVMGGVAAVAAGKDYTLALKTDGTVWAWGDNSLHQSGATIGQPGTVPRQLLTGARAIAAGNGHSLALRTDGALLAWGDNSSGQLGTGAPQSSVAAPAQVMAGVAGIAAGGASSLAIRTDGTVYAWGDSLFGQLGDAGIVARTAPVPVPGGAVAVAAGASHSAAIKTDGTLWTWGYNGYGQLGNGTTADRSAPQQVLASVRAVATGENHTLAVRSDGNLWAWGDGVHGQLGDGYAGDDGSGGSGATLTHTITSPTMVLATVNNIAAGGLHSLATKNDGTLWAWGSNDSGQLGLGALTWTSSPTLLMSGARNVSAGYQHSLAIKIDGTLWAWGRNDNGQLGTGDTANRSAPVLVLADVQSVSAGAYHTLALKTDGTLWVWGWNFYGQLGDGTVTDRSLPRQIMAGIRIAVAGGNASYALGTDGKFYSWGTGYAGMQGPGSGGWSQTTPLRNPYLRNVTQIAGGAGHVLVRTADGGVLAWGSNRSQQLGIARVGQRALPLPLVDPVATSAGARPVIEYFNPTVRNGAGNAGIGHYFITGAADEAASVDAGGSGPGWGRTGRTFGAWPDAASAPAGAVGVCRFYARVPNSHFYTAAAAECQSLKNLNPANDPNAGWAYEGIAFHAVPPQAGGCPAGYFPVYRSYNNRFSADPALNDGNHRITPSDNDTQRLTRFLGFVDEGVAFCSPVSTGSGADLQATFTYPGASVQGGTRMTAEFLFGNNGTGKGDGGTIYAVLPPEVLNWNISCAATRGAACPASITPDLLRGGLPVTVWPAGGGLKLVATGTAPQPATAAEAMLVFGATVANAGGNPDPNPANDTPPIAQTVVRGPSACNYVPSPAMLSLGPAAQNPHVSVVTNTGCLWTAASSVPWLSVAPAAGSGDATLALALAANTTPTERTGTVTINGQVIQVSQSGAICTYAADPAVPSLGAATESKSVTISALGGCRWNAQSAASWLTLQGANGDGSGTLVLVAATNAGQNSRSGTVTIGSKTLQVVQAGSAQAPVPPPPLPDPCASLRLERQGDQVAFTPSGGPNLLQVYADDQCGWRAQSNAAWVTLTSGGGGGGNGVVGFLVEENIVERPRNASITVGSRTFAINQTRFVGLDPGYRDAGGN